MISSAGYPNSRSRAGIPARDDTVRAQHADRVVLHAVEEQAQFVFGKPKPLGVVLQLGIERNDAAIGLVELSVGTLERAGFVFVESVRQRGRLAADR